MLLIAGLLQVSRAQDVPEPGTAITNEAGLEYADSDSAETINGSSNTVKTIINAFERFKITQAAPIEVVAGNSFEIPHQLKNTGNIETDIVLTVSNKGGDQYDVTGLSLMQENAAQPKAKAKASGSAVLAANNMTVTLQPGETLDFYYTATVSPEVAAGSVAEVLVHGVGQTQGYEAQQTDQVGAISGPLVNISKEISGGEAIQGGTLTYTLAGDNSGGVAAHPMEVTVDGQPQRRVLIRDEIPLHTNVRAVDDPDAGIPLYHLSGAPNNRFVTDPPANMNLVDEVGLALDTLRAGQTFNWSFEVDINENAVGEMVNAGEVHYTKPSESPDEIFVERSNEVAVELPEYVGDISFYSDSTYSVPINVETIGSDMHVQADDANSNINRSQVDTVTIRLRSPHTDDQEIYRGIETGVNSGYFRIVPAIPSRDGAEDEVVEGNDIMEVVRNGTVDAEMQEGGNSDRLLQDEVVVSPYGVVFDSQNNDPVSGVEVTLIDVTGDGNGGNAGGAAEVYEETGREQMENPQTTAVDGEIAFPYLKPSTYRLEVETPEGYTFASKVPADQLPEGREVDPAISYGETFTIEGEAGSFSTDIPVDPETVGMLFVDKNADRDRVTIGDFVRYEVTVTNNADTTITLIRLVDTLPFGFKYEEGTARLDGEVTDDPDDPSAQLTFDIGALEGGETATLTYWTLAGPGAQDGDGINTAQAFSDEPLGKESNKATAKVEVDDGVFSDEGYIIGKVFMDCNKNGMQDKGEPGVPGVQLFLEDGTFVITDSQGLYSFYGIKPNKHVLKLDNYSIPEGATLEVLDNRNALDPSSRFVDLKKGQMHRADFALCNCSEEVEEQIAKRQQEFGLIEGELDEAVSKELTRNGSSRMNIRQEQASGIVGSRNLPSKQTADADSTSASAATTDGIGLRSGVGLTDKQRPDSSDAVAILADIQNNDLDFVDIADGDTLGASQLSLKVKSPAGSNIQLYVNEQKVSQERIGRSTVLKPKQAQLIEYVGIQLQPGINTLRISEVDPFGNNRGEKKIQVRASGELADVDFEVVKDQVPADGSSTAIVRARLLDSKGVTTDMDLPVTLDASFGRWKAEDRDPQTPGTQTVIKEGMTEFELEAPRQPGTSKSRISIGMLKKTVDVHFLPDLRPLLAAGIIEGTIRLNGSADIMQAHEADGFERELKTLSYSEGNWTADSRAAFYLKGKVKGDVLLTASFDSEKDEERLFRDIQPDQFYPVYGDASIRGFDAQSTSRLYVRLEKGRTYAMFGDFITQRRDPARRLGEYNRTVNGIKAHYETDRAKLNVFGTQTEMLQRIEEFRAEGVSGPYSLPHSDIRLHSEKVELVTRDRDQPSIIIDRESLSRFRDYMLEPYSGNLMFKSPVPSLDENMNPIYIRVTYEVEGGGESYLLGGADASLKVNEMIEVGGSIVEDRNPENNYRLMSVNTTFNLSENIRLIAEAAQTETDIAGSGQGGRVELQHKGKDLNLRAYAGKTDEDFTNRAATFGQGRTEAGLRGKLNITNSTKLQGEFLHTSNDTSGAQTTGGLLGIQQRITEDIRIELGARHVQQSGSALGNTNVREVSNTNLRGKVTTALPGVDQASLFGEYEQDINEAGRKAIAVGGDYQIPDRGRLYARHEFVSSALGRYALDKSQQRNRTIVGLDADYMKNGKVYSEYRVNDAFDGRSAQAAIGLRNRFMIDEGFGINAGVERIFSLEGGPPNEGTAISSSIDYTANPMWKGTARAETRFSPNGDLYLGTLGYGHKISRDWAFLGKNIFALQTSSSAGTKDRIQQRLRLGMAYRQTETNRWNGLGRYELKYEEFGDRQDDYQRMVHIFSIHGNYHPNPDWTFSARYAGKYLAQKARNEIDAQSITQMLSARTMYDITRRLDISVTGSIMGNEDFTTRDFGLGAEVGIVAIKNLRLAVGANLFGFEDRDLTESNYSRKGVYIGFSYKFDEQLFKGLMPEGNVREPNRYLPCGTCVASGKVLDLPDDYLNLDEIMPEPVDYSIPNPDFEYIDALALLPDAMHFATDKSVINQDAAFMLDIFTFFLRRHDEYKLFIKGHTDHDFTYEYNKALSERRARAIQAYLLASGVNPENMEYRGLAYDDPTVTESDVLDKAHNRRVDFSLDVPNVDIYFLPQLEDLQVDPEPEEWQYIFDFRHNAAPDRIHFETNTAQLNFVAKYMMKRIALVLDDKEEVTAEFRIAPSDNSDLATRKAEALQQMLSDLSVQDDRYNITVDSSVVQSNQVRLTYSPDDELIIVSQHDDIQLAGDQRYRSLLDKAWQLLDRREDGPLIREIPGLYYLPERLTVDSRSEELSVETAAVLSRIGSYMRNNPSSVIRVEANNSLQSHLPLVREFLIDWGIDRQRIRINDMVNETIPANEIRFNDVN